jgi:hypothetical protein
MNRLKNLWLEFRVWLKVYRVSLGALALVVVAALVFTVVAEPSVPYDTIMTILRAFVDLTGVLIAFAAVVSAQVLAACRSQIQHGTNAEEALRHTNRFALLFHLTHRRSSR